jgi:hypothetical protein
MSLMMEMDGKTEQDLHGSGPGQAWMGIHHSLQITQLVSQTELMKLGRGIHLGAISIADPDLGRKSLHHIPDDIHTAVVMDDIQYRLAAPEHPFPPIITL